MINLLLQASLGLSVRRSYLAFDVQLDVFFGDQSQFTTMDTSLVSSNENVVSSIWERADGCEVLANNLWGCY